MKRILFAALFVTTSAVAQTSTPAPPTQTPVVTGTPVPTDTPQLVQAEAAVPRYISVVRFEATTQYGPNIPNGTLDMTYEFVVSDQNGNEMQRRTHVLQLNKIPTTVRKGLSDFLKWIRNEVESRVLPPAALTPFPTLTPVPSETPAPTAVPTP